MKKTNLFMLIVALIVNLSALTAQIQTGVFRTPVGNTDYHQFLRNSTGAAVFINQESSTGPILRLSSGTATADQGVKFSFENSGNLGIGTTTSILEKMVLYNADTIPTLTQYGNTKSPLGATKGFVVGIVNNGTGTVWHREALPISFGTSNKERMRITSDGYLDMYGSIRSATKSYQIDTTGVFQSNGYRTKADNVNYHQFIANTTSNAVVYVNQALTGPILRLSSGTATYNQNVKFSFESSGNLGIGTTSVSEKLTMYTTDTLPALAQYGNSRCNTGANRGFVVGVVNSGYGTVWQRETLPISFGTSNKERMRITSDGYLDMYSPIRSATKSYQIDTTGIFQSKGYRTKADNVNYHQFTRNSTGTAVFINQESTGPILRLSSGTATVDQNVKFSFENSGNLGIGTTSVSTPQIRFRRSLNTVIAGVIQALIADLLLE